MAGTHKILSPSKAAMWSRCLGALAMGRGLPNESSEYADEGTAYHYVSEQALNSGKDCDAWVGHTIIVTADEVFDAEEIMLGARPTPDGFYRSFVVDYENAAYAQKYVDTIRENTIVADFKTEVWVDLSALLGVPDQGGTSDAVIFKTLDKTIEVHDLKFGRGEVVHAYMKPEEGQPSWMGANEQLLLYGAGAMLMFKDVCDWEKVKIAIHQPRLGHYTYHSFRRDQVREFIRYMRERAQRAYQLYDSVDAIVDGDAGSAFSERAGETLLATLTPGEKQCRWCPRRGNCPARNQSIINQFPLVPADQRLVKTGGLTNRIQTVVNPTPVLWQLTEQQIADAMERVDDIEQWCKDIKAEAHSRAISGKEIPGWKLTTGRKGNRAWEKDGKIIEEDELTGLMEYTIEEFMVQVLGTAAYDKPSVVSPATAEKLMRRFPEKWAQLQAVITQSEGNKTLVRATDPRPAAEATTAQFGLTDEFGANIN